LGYLYQIANRLEAWILALASSTTFLGTHFYTNIHDCIAKHKLFQVGVDGFFIVTILYPSIQWVMRLSSIWKTFSYKKFITWQLSIA